MRTGIGAMACANQTAYARAASEEAPSAPDKWRGSPTYTHCAPRSCTSRTICSTSLDNCPVAGFRVSRASVATGVAISPSGSLAARPTRTEPTSTPRRAPRTTSTSAANRGHDRLERLAELGGIRPAALREVVLAATATAEHARGELHERSGADA